jgi:hypothetical protein
MAHTSGLRSCLGHRWSATTLKANEHTKKVKVIAQKVLDEAHDVMDDKTVRAS